MSVMGTEHAETILLVDDNSVNLKILFETLRDTGARLLVAQSGAEALSLVSGGGIDLVISDILMPEMSGFRLLEILKSDERTRDVPVLLMSALSETRDKVRGFELGAVDYVTKPFQREEVIARTNVQLSLARQRKQLEFFARMDSLTGLFNRRFALETIAAEIERSVRLGLTLSLAIFDVDFFKRVNDTHGHLVGDEVLRRVATEIRGAIRSYDVAGRYGGEEFVVCFPETDGDAAMAAADKVRRSVEALSSWAGAREISVTLSGGIASSSPDGESSGHEELDALVSRADAALYAAKTSGRNRICGESLSV